MIDRKHILLIFGLIPFILPSSGHAARPPQAMQEIYSYPSTHYYPSDDTLSGPSTLPATFIEQQINGFDGSNETQHWAGSNDIKLKAADAVNGIISVPDINACVTGQTVRVKGNGQTPVSVPEYVWWPNKIVRLNARTVEVIDQHGCSPTIILINVPTVYFADGSSLSLATVGAGVCGSSNGASGSAAPTGNLCNAGTASSVTGSGPWTWSCSGINGGANASCSTLSLLSCVDANGTSHASGSTYSLQTSQTSGSIPATLNQCAYGGTQPTTTTVTQSYSCTNGVSIAQGASVSTTVNNGNPSCNAPAACGSTPSGSTVTQTVSTTPGSIAATLNQCAYGGTQPTTTTITQLQLCTKGTLTNQGDPVTTTVNNGNPICDAAPAVTPNVTPSPVINGQCGTASGGSANAAPVTGLCASGTASAVSGTGPWAWTCNGANNGTSASCATAGSCFGTLTPAPAAIIMPPSVPQPQAGNDIVGVNLQNTTSAATGNHIITFGQVFAYGQVQPGDTLVARIYGAANQVQMDTLSTWPDGSVKLAAITLGTNICANSTVPALLSKATSSDPVFNTAPVSLTLTPVNLTATLTFGGGQYYSGTQAINLGTALQTALANNPSYWLQGPLARQARVDLPLPGGPMHLTADVTAYADGSVTADVQFNNDLTTILPQSGSTNPQAPLPLLNYTATVTLGSVSQSYPVSQDQYTDWHTVLTTTGAPTFYVSSSAEPSLNVQHDLAYLEHTGAILPYDRTTGVANTTPQAYVGEWSGQPLAGNAVTAYMPTTGGRRDIGYTTQFNTVWLVTQDARAAAIGLAQSDTSGAVPWNFKLANGHWLTPGDDAAIWTDGRGGPQGYTDGIAYNFDTSVWTPDTAHQPNLNYVPYIMTGSRWNLDRLNAQAAFALNNDWPGNRCQQPAASGCPGLSDIILNGSDQIRGEAWSLREIEEAAFVGKPGSFEQGYYTTVLQDNWTFVQSQEATLTATGGQVYGYWGLGAYGDGTPEIPEWEEDYLTGTVALGAEMGSAGAQQFIAWQKDAWLAGRFNVPSNLNMNPYDGCNYNLTTGYTNNGSVVAYTTWSAIESATLAAGGSNGPNNSLNWWQSNGDYCALARAALGASLTLYPSDTNLSQALTWLNRSGAPQMDQATFQNDPTFNVVPLQ